MDSSSVVLGLVKSHLAEAKLMQIATSVENIPWIASCWFSADENLNLYFISRKSRRHSHELLANTRVACAIVKAPIDGMGQKVQGLQLEGTAQEVSGQELVHAYDVCQTKWSAFKSHITLEQLQQATTEVRIYKVVPTMIVWFDEINFPEDPRKEIGLDN